jgi:dihydrofolate reductase
MGKVTADMSISLDGFITGPNDGVELPLGEGGERLHEWVYDLRSFRERHGQEGGKTGRDDEVLEEAFATTGAFLMGRRMFDVGEGPWGDDPPFHAPLLENTGPEQIELETTRVIGSPRVTHLKFRVPK